MSVEFHTYDYEMSHGHKPRGRGSWAFFFRRNAPVTEAFFAPSPSTYADAKKAAVAEAVKRFGPKCCGNIFVGS